ncbi:MAG: rhomboid family intramembrane serine protease [Bacteroidetes bacterium]|nr:MAG: rhomboid family intramembrane serine protease [Bacteroidota bacterium]
MEKNVKYTSWSLMLINSIIVICYFLSEYNVLIIDSLKLDQNQFPESFASLFTYSLLHGNIWHLIVNVVLIFSYGKKALTRFDDTASIHVMFIFVWVLSSISGALAFMISEDQSTLVGSSAFVFALMSIYNSTIGSKYWIIFVPIAIAMEYLLCQFTGFNLAVNAHLGGCITGSLIAILLRMFDLRHYR